MRRRPRRFWFIVLALLTLVIALGVGWQMALSALKTQVQQAMGPDSEITSVHAGLGGVELRGVRLRAPTNSQVRTGWPNTDQLRAERISVTPDIRSLLSARIHIRRIRVEGAYLAMQRTRDGRLRVLPGLLEGRAANNGSTLPEITIGRVELADSALEFFDASVRQPAVKIRLEQLQAESGQMRLPDLKGRMPLRIEGVIKGVQRDGRLSISGDIELASKDSVLNTRLRGVDLVTLQPYFVQPGEAGVRRGQLDLDLKSTVKQRQLNAPGTLTLTQLEFASGSYSFAGLPRDAVLGFMKDKNGQLQMSFTLSGNLDDPNFSLNENFAVRVASSMAGVLGISFEGIARGVGAVGQAGASAAGDVLQGVGNVFKGLLGK